MYCEDEVEELDDIGAYELGLHAGIDFRLEAPGKLDSSAAVLSGTVLVGPPFIILLGTGLSWLVVMETSALQFIGLGFGGFLSQAPLVPESSTPFEADILVASAAEFASMIPELECSRVCAGATLCVTFSVAPIAAALTVGM